MCVYVRDRVIDECESTVSLCWPEYAHQQKHEKIFQ